MDSEKTKDLSFVESTLNSYVTPESKFGGWGKNDEPYGVWMPTPDAK